MKIIAQSTTVSTPPYVHLGYLATTIIHYSKPLTDVCLALIVIGLAVGIQFQKTGLRWKQRFNLVLRRPLWLGRLSVAAAVAGLLTLLIAPASYTSIPARPGALTRMRMNVLYGEVMLPRDEADPLPDSLQQFAAEHLSWAKDEWALELRYEKFTRDGVPDCRLTSAGPDQIFDTPDDIVYPPETD